jgi:tetratricopeptide (TPR) repeat protein
MFLGRAVVLALACVFAAGLSAAPTIARAQESADLKFDDEEEIIEEGEELPAADVDLKEDPPEEEEDPPLEPIEPKPVSKPVGKTTRTTTAAAPTQVRLAPPKQPKVVVPAPPVEETPVVLSEDRLREHIEARARFLRAGDNANADAELALIFESRQQLGVQNIVLASAELIHEATLAEDQNNLAHAIELAESAARLSPQLEEAHWRRARLYFAQSWTQLDLIFGAVSDLISAKLGRFRNTISLLTNIAALIALALLATIAIFTLVQLYKYVRYAAYDVSKFLPSWFGTGEVVMLLLMVIAAPLVFRFGILPTLVLALGAIYAYQAKRERGVTIASWVLLAAAPGLIWLVSPLVIFHGSQVDAIESALSETFASGADAKLIEQSRAPGFGVVSSLALAHRHRVRGDIKAAEDEYRRALTIDPGNVVARNNLGTLLFLQGHEEAAQATFQAATMRGERAEPLLNLASILVDQSLFEQANSNIESARKLDRDLTEHYTRVASSLPTREKLLSADTSQGPMWSLLFDVEPDRRLAITQQIFGIVGANSPLWMAPVFVILVALFAVGLAKRSQTKPLCVPCPKCGVPAQRDAPASYCEQCQSIFLKAIAVEPVLRIQKESEVISYQRRRRWTERAFSVLAGAGDIFGGRPIVGTILVFFFVAMLAIMRFTEGFVVNPWSVCFDAAAHTLKIGVAIGIAVILVLFSVRQSLK